MNEPVVSRNTFHRTKPWSGVELTLWLWTGGTKGSLDLQDGDPGRQGRRAAIIKGWGHTRPCRAKIKTFYFVYPTPSIICTGYTDMSISLTHSPEM